MTTSAQARRWAKTGATQQRILDAATAAFATRGYTATTMADVVAGSGASVGSIYHHFGGKRELFLAIFEQMADAVDRRIGDAMRHTGDSRPDGRRLFDLHVRAYLEAMWDNRRLAQSVDVRRHTGRVRGRPSRPHASRLSQLDGGARVG